MSWNPVPLAGGHYTDNARPWANQEVVNWLPVKPERPGARSELMLRDVPGLRPFSVVGTGPIRGAHNAEGTLFVVSGTGLYRISPLGVASSLGTIPGVGRVSMAHNQVTGGNQVVVANGSAAYVYDTTDDTLTQITDEGFPGAKSVRFLGQMILYVEPFGRFWGSSDLADATSYNTIFRQEAEGSPDLILHVEPSQGEALVFGKRTIEVWSNQVTENANFQRTTVIERGAASGNAIVTLDNSCIFLGDDGILYRLNGYTPVPISTRPLEFNLKDYDLSKAFAFTWEDAGFKVVYFTVPGGLTWGYDVATGELHRRESYGLDRWRLNTLTPFARKWIGGDFADGTLWELDWDYHKEGCDEIVRVCRPPMMHNGGNRVRVNGLRFEVDMGEAADPLEASIAGTLPDGPAGEVVNYQYTIAGYVEGDEVSGIAVTSGALPEGLSISTTGLVTGTRESAGVYTFTVAGTDRCGNAVSLADTSETTGFTIQGDLLGGFVGQGSTGTYTNTNGFGEITYAVTAGTFPDGVTLDPGGSWAGNFTTAGAPAWTITGTDEAGNTATLEDTATITGPYAFASSSTTADFYRLDAGTNVVTTQALGGDKFEVVAMPGLAHVWVSDRDNGKVYKVNPTTLATDFEVAIAAPYGMACDATHLYVYNQTDHQIHKILASDGSPVTTFAVDVGNRGWMTLSPDGGTLWIAGDASAVIRYVNTTTGTATSVALPAVPGARPCVNPAGTKVYVPCSLDNIQVIDTATKAIIGTTLVFGAKQIAFLPDGSKFYITSTLGSGNVQVHDGADDSFITEIDTTGALFGVCADPSGTRVFAIGHTGDHLYEINSATDAILTTHVLTNPCEAICSRALP